MEFEQFKEFMLQSAAQHDARIAAIEESMKQIANTTAILVDNQVHLQDHMDQLTVRVDRVVQTLDRVVETVDRMATKIDKLHEIVFRHSTDPGAHNGPVN